MSEQTRVQAAPVVPTGFAIEDTDCHKWFSHMARVDLKYFGPQLDVQKKFKLPARLPWKEVLVIYDPGLTVWETLEKARYFPGVNIRVSDEAQEHIGENDRPNGSKLYIVQRDLCPTAGTMGLPAKYALHWLAGRQTVPLPLSAYVIGCCFLNWVTAEVFDQETTTVFPKNLLPVSGPVVHALYENHLGLAVNIKLGDAADDNPRVGFREAIVLEPVV
ncbi:MAG: hypothetical protein V4467_01645 [Patescibacteria group bacterium]